MKLTYKLLATLQNRLKIGNRTSVHLNAIPSKSRYKFDICRLAKLDAHLPDRFIKELLEEPNLKFKISWQDNLTDLNGLMLEDQAHLVQISRSLENLINQTETIESEKGINTFGFGFPILVRRDIADNKITVAPIFIWSLRIKRSKQFNTWEIQRSTEDLIYLNEVLANHLLNDAKVNVGNLTAEVIEDGMLNFDELVATCAGILTSINIDSANSSINTLNDKLSQVISIPERGFFEDLLPSGNDAIIHPGGLFSIFEVQKQNVINDYSRLFELDGLSLDLEDLESHTFQPLSGVDTDPSQQSILNQLQTKRNILIQGPPGTGKSQSLTAILVNALENHKKTIVVCEKRTALEVLYNALEERGLTDHCVLIKDIVKDRKTVVDSVRERLDRPLARYTGSPKPKTSLNQILRRAQELIDKINTRQSKLNQHLLGGKDWTSIVGYYLQSAKATTGNVKIAVDPGELCFDADELDRLLIIAEKGERLYINFAPIEPISFLNPAKFLGTNEYALEEDLKNCFSKYSIAFSSNDSMIGKVLSQNLSIEDLLNTGKTSKPLFRLLTLFSKNRKELVSAQKRLQEGLDNLISAIWDDGWLDSHERYESLRAKFEFVKEVLSKWKTYKSLNEDSFVNEFYWHRFFNELTELEKAILNSLKGTSNWKDSVLAFYLDATLRQHATEELSTDPYEYEDLGKNLSKIGMEQLDYVQKYWFAKQVASARDFNDRNPRLNVENLYNKRSGPKFKRLSLRSIVNEDTELFTTFFPIILTTPEVCSNLFQGKNKLFDIVLFDEASQLRVEENLPAMLKGKQVIIAGDEHQMPPSNYFSKVFDGSIDDDDDADEEAKEIAPKIDRDDLLLECESLLDFATELSFEKRYLDFHYRSKHPHLIDFSNHAFYNKRLKPLPTSTNYKAITYLQVHGTYSEHENDAEADAVLKILENNIQLQENGKYPSVGIATFNIAQRNLIKRKIAERRKFEHYSQFNEKIDALEEAGLFIKNLENIQGDERDVLILSTTYGVDKSGKFSQRFGPINHSKGYKLLNVIITRAKHKVFICTSIPEEVFLNYQDHLVTEGSNNRRAVFFAYLAYAKFVSEGDEIARETVLSSLSKNTTTINSIDSFNPELESPFEEEVYEALKAEFGEEKLKPQVNFAGFRIDIVYDPGLSGLKKIAIECDGATYHSSKEAYLYDYHRQRILENHGFIFHRIWSTNWWRNAQKETDRLIEFIKSVESSKQTTEFLVENSRNQGFNDQVDWVSNYSVTELNLNQSNASAYIENLRQRKPQSPQNTLFELDEIIERKSIVRLKYLNNGKSILIQLSEKGGQLNATKIEGIQQVSFKSPLGTAILGKKKGDTVRIGDLDNFVEILEIQ